MASVRDRRRVIVAGCVASSKTMAAAMTTLWWLSAFAPSRVFAVAPTHRQVSINLFGEIRRLYLQSKIPLGGKIQPESPELKIGHNWYALGFSTDEPDRVHGIHGPNDLLIVDEGQGIQQSLWDAIENAMAGGNSKMLVLCNPNVLAGTVYDAFHSQRSRWHPIKISAFDTPNVKEKRLVIPGMITHEQVEEWRRVYGEDSNFFRVKVKAEFPSQESDTLIPLDWIELAMARELPRPVIGEKESLTLGVDVARFGDDRTVIFPVRGRRVLPAIVITNADTMSVAGRVLLEHQTRSSNSIFVDEIGLGAGVRDRLKELNAPVRGVNVAGKPSNIRKFVNLRSELWWRVRELLDPANPNALALPRDNELAAELSSCKYEVDSAGRIKIEPKDDMKARLGMSPDKADALCMAMMGSNEGRAAAQVYTRPALGYGGA